MKELYLKIFIFQTLMYTLFWIFCYYDGLKPEVKLLWKPMLITVYIISVLFSTIIPYIKEFIIPIIKKKFLK